MKVKIKKSQLMQVVREHLKSINEGINKGHPCLKHMNDIVTNSDGDNYCPICKRTISDSQMQKLQKRHASMNKNESLKMSDGKVSIEEFISKNKNVIDKYIDQHAKPQLKDRFKVKTDDIRNMWVIQQPALRDWAKKFGVRFPEQIKPKK